MGDTSLSELAQALQVTAEDGLLALEQLMGDPAAARFRDTLNIAVARKHLVAEAGTLLSRLAPHERLVRGLAAVGTLAHFPTFSSDLVGLKPGDIVLVRAPLLELHTTEAVIRLITGNLQQRPWVNRRNIMGVEREPAQPPR